MEERNIKAAEGKWRLAEERGKEEAQRFVKRTRGTITYQKADSGLK